VPYTSDSMICDREIIAMAETPTHAMFVRVATCEDGSVWALLRNSNYWQMIPRNMVDADQCRPWLRG
jgi:hypothetical protein